MKKPAPLLNATQTIITLLLWLLCYVAWGQAPSKDLQQYMPQPFIDKIELVVGPSLNIPNDHGWAEYTVNSSGSRFTEVVKNKIGYFVGIGLAHSIGKRFELTARVLYDRKGYKEESASQYSQTKIDYKYDYVTLAVQPRYHLGKAKKFHVFVGGSFGILTQSKFEDRFFDNGQLVNINISAYDIDAQKYDVNLCAGLGYCLNLSNRNSLLFHLQGNQGVLDITKANLKRVTSKGFSFSIAFRHNRVIQKNQFVK
jgi:hypothetical protein